MNLLTFIPTKKTVLTLFILIIALFIVGTFLAPVLSTDRASQVSAAAEDRTFFGWAWSDNVGWISFNCDDTSSCASVNYSVIADGSGDLSGYAWSDNIGWVSFNSSDLSGCPSGACKAKLAGNSLQGWGRALSYGDGWDGWVSLNGPSYGITLNNPNFEGFAWDASDVGGQAIGSGWIQFNPAFGGVTVTPTNPQCSDGIDNDGDDLIDAADPGCWGDPTDPSTYDPDDPSEGVPQCSDGIDNDGDDLIDAADPGCWSDPTDPSTYDPDDPIEAGPQCSDTVDNTDPEDALADTADPGCYDSGGYDPNDTDETDTLPECSNFFDDDGNGLIDDEDPGCWGDPTDPGTYDPNDPDEGDPIPQCSDGVDNTDPEDTLADTADPGCYDSGSYDPNDTSETDTLPECSNFFDDDGDGKVDYPDDPGCSSASDDDEVSEPPSISCTPDLINKGNPSAISWSCVDSTSSTGDENFSTGGAVSGSVDITPSDTTTYTVFCSNGGQNSCTVTVISPELTIISNPTLVRSGSSSTIIWSATSVNSCSVTGPGFFATGTSGSRSTGAIEERSTYTLICQTDAGAVSDSVTVKILPKFQEF